MQSGSFMDGLSVAWRVQRRVSGELRRGLDLWFGLWSVPTRGDVSRLENQIASLERQLRAVRGELDRARR